MEKQAIVRLIIIGFLVLCAIACSPRIVEHVRTEYLYKDREVRDSLYFRDSIYVKEKVKEDTVWIEKYIDRWRYREREVHDTTMVEVHDTTTVEKLIEKQLTPMQKAKQDAFWGLILSIVIALLWIFRKPIKKLFGL